MSAKSLNLQWDFAPYQADAYEALESGNYDLVILRTGYGGGKTVFGSRYVIEKGLAIPDGHSLVLAPDRQKGGPATYKGFFEQLPGEKTVPNEADGDPENSPIVAGYHGTKHRLTLVNGHIIQLGGADIWSRFAGSEFNVIWCDEVAHYNHTNLYDLHEMLVTRQRTPQGPNVTLWTSTGNGYEQFYDISEREVDMNDEPLTWADSMKVIVGSSLDNPWLNEKDKMIRQFKGTEREAQALHGGFAAAQGLVYNDFSRNVHVKPHEALADSLQDRRVYGYDYGWDDPRVILEMALTDSGQLAIVDEYYQREKPVEHAIRWLNENDKERGVMVCDHDPEHIDKFRQAGFKAKAATKNIDEGIEAVRRRLEVNNGRPGLVISDRCGNTISEFLSYKEEHVGTSKAEDHAMDVCRYVCVLIDGVRKKRSEPGFR